MTAPDWSPAPAAVEAAGRVVMAQGSALIRATIYARKYLEQAPEDPDDADMAAFELEDMHELVAALVYALRGLDPDGESARELSADEWAETQRWLLAQFPD